MKSSLTAIFLLMSLLLTGRSYADADTLVNNSAPLGAINFEGESVGPEFGKACANQTNDSKVVQCAITSCQSYVGALGASIKAATIITAACVQDALSEEAR